MMLLLRLLGSFLGNSQRLAEQYRFNGHWKLLEQWLQQFVNLRAPVRQVWAKAVPRPRHVILCVCSWMR